MTTMKTSERFEDRNVILAVIDQIDSELIELSVDKSFRSVALCREMLETRRELARELSRLGFPTPTLDGRLKIAGGRIDSRFARSGPSLGGGGGVVAKRRIGPPTQGF